MICSFCRACPEVLSYLWPGSKSTRRDSDCPGSSANLSRLILKGRAHFGKKLAGSNATHEISISFDKGSIGTLLVHMYLKNTVFSENCRKGSKKFPFRLHSNTTFSLRSLPTREVQVMFSLILPAVRLLEENSNVI